MLQWPVNIRAHEVNDASGETIAVMLKQKGDLFYGFLLFFCCFLFFSIIILLDRLSIAFVVVSKWLRFFLEPASFFLFASVRGVDVMHMLILC